MRRNIPSVVAGVALVLLLVLYMITYQVRFNEIAIKTTFGKPSDPNLSDPNAAGLRFKWPWPIQGVVKYDNRIRILDSPQEQAQTQDRQILILTTFCGWRIADGVAFLQNLETVSEAENRLLDHLRAAIGAAVGQHVFSDFVSTNAEELELDEIEKEIQEEVARLASPYGIQIETLGIRRVILPTSTTEKVFAQMRAQRTAMAQKTQSEGEAIAQKMRSEAESLQQQILAFAARKAEAIRAEGEAAAAQEYQVFKKDEEFATFLRELEFLETAFKNRTIFFLDEDTLGVEMLKQNRPILGSEPTISPPKEPKPAKKKTKASAETKTLPMAVLQESQK